MPIFRKRNWGRARRLLLVCAVVLLFPYAVTLAVSGGESVLVPMEEQQSGLRVYLEGKGGYVDAEEYLTGVVAAQIPMEYEMEAIKAQAMAARTWLFRQADGDGRITVTAAEPGYLQEVGNGSLWEEEHFPEYYEKARQAVTETAGQVICYEGSLIEPLFHRASAGRTRTGDEAHPYLQAADSSFDVEAEGYLTVLEWTPEEFAALADGESASGDREAGGSRIAGDGAGDGMGGGFTGGGAGDGMGGGFTGGGAGDGMGGGFAGDGAEGADSADRILETMQLVSRDSSGYVAEYQIGSHVYTGEEIRQLFGLPSLSFRFENHEGNIRAVCEGQGHALGLSQYGAHHLASEGLSAEEILRYYYHGITVESWNRANLPEDTSPKDM